MNKLRRSFLHTFSLLLLTWLVASCSVPTQQTTPLHPLVAGMPQTVPLVTITTSDGEPIESKSVYSEATVLIDGNGYFADFQGDVEVRGRGNSTWAYGLREGKKPYRLRLPEKTEILGLPAERNWILLANYLDITLMGNVIAFTTAQFLDMPFTHTMIPVDLVVNGEFMGSYLLTEHKEVTSNRIDIGADGLLIELDSHFDEEYQFMSDTYDLPVMIQHPDLGKLLEEDAEAQLAAIVSDFSALELAVKPGEVGGNDLPDLLNPESFAKLMVVFQLTANRELNHPKSIYMYRLAGATDFHFGPVWDFDWAYGYDTANRRPFTNPTVPLIEESAMPGAAFFADLMEDPVLRAAFKAEWEAFYAASFPSLIQYVRRYGRVIQGSYNRDYDRWHETPEQFAREQDFNVEIERMVAWLEARAEYVSELVASY